MSQNTPWNQLLPKVRLVVCKRRKRLHIALLLIKTGQGTVCQSSDIDERDHLEDSIVRGITVHRINTLDLDVNLELTQHAYRAM